MKLMLLLLLLTSQAYASFEEGAVLLPGSKLPKKRFQAVIQILENEFQSLAGEHGRVLEFQTDYDEDWAQAFARRWETDQVVVYGGASGLNNGTEDSFAMILCHELGHFYGGRPFTEEHNKLAVEGQADYWATQECFKRVVLKLTTRIPAASSLLRCADDGICARALDAALVVSAFYADNRSLPHPEIETPDLTVVPATLFTHPTPQCRLDTMWAGLTQRARPACWFFENMFNP